MQQFTQRHSNTIAISAISGSVLILLFGIGGALISRKAPEASQSPKVQPSQQPLASLSPSVTPTPSASPSPAESPQQSAPLQAPQSTQEQQGGLVATVQIEPTELKSDADPKSETVGRFHSGQVVNVFQIEGDWVNVGVGAMVGYVPAKSLSQPVALPKPQVQESQGAAFKAQYL